MMCSYSYIVNGKKSDIHNLQENQKGKSQKEGRSRTLTPGIGAPANEQDMNMCLESIKYIEIKVFWIFENLFESIMDVFYVGETGRLSQEGQELEFCSSFHRNVSFLVSVILWPPLCLIVTVLTLQNCVTVLSWYVSLEMNLLCSLIVTLITRILDSPMFRSVM